MSIRYIKGLSPTALFLALSLGSTSVAVGSLNLVLSNETVRSANPETVVAGFSKNSAPNIWPTQEWETATPSEMDMDEALLLQARDYALTAGGSGIITRSGMLVMSWGDLSTRYDLKSTTKSIGATTLGLALYDDLVNLEDAAQLHLSEVGLPPEDNSSTGWLDRITLKHLATHTAGFDKQGGFIDLLFEPGSAWSYSDGSANWLADLLTVTYGLDLNDVMFSRVFDFLGIQNTDLVWRDNNYRGDTIDGIKRREFGSGISANVDAMARIGYLYLRSGQWENQSILSSEFIQMASQPIPGVVGLPELAPDDYPNASEHYGLLWWNNADGTLADVPTDAYWSWGLFDSLIVVIPSLDIVISRAGSGWRSGWNGDYSVIDPFITPIVQSVTVLPAPDTTPPNVSIFAPVPDAIVSGLVAISVDADDNVAVTVVELFVDDVYSGTDTSAPYQFDWDTTTVTNGIYSLTVVARDDADNTAESSINVTVDSAVEEEEEEEEEGGEEEEPENTNEPDPGTDKDNGNSGNGGGGGGGGGCFLTIIL